MFIAMAIGGHINIRPAVQYLASWKHYLGEYCGFLSYNYYAVVLSFSTKCLLVD